MPRGSEKLLSLVTPEAIRDFTENYESPAMELQSLFAIRNTDAIIAEAKLLSEDGETTPMASIHARNTSVKMAARPNWETLRAETMLIKEAIPVTAVMQEFMDNGMDDPAFFFNNIFNNFQRRMDAVRLRRYAMATEPLSTGQITVNENNVKATINIGFNPDNMIFTDWTSPTADIIGDFTRLHALAKRRGKTITRAITSTKVAKSILTNTGVKNLYQLMNMGTGFTTSVAGAAFERVLNVVTNLLFGVTIRLNDEVFEMMDADGTRKEYRVYDENKITFFTGALNAQVGVILAGRTEEEVMWGLQVGDVRPVVRASDGVTTARWDTDNPPQRFLQAATVALPIYPAIKNMYIAKVL